MSVGSMFDKGLRVTPAPLFHRRARTRLTVLAYHAIDDGDRFTAHLRILRELAQPVSLQDVIDDFYGRRSLPDHAVLVTFDDNHRSILEVALPRLVAMKIPAVAFVIAGCLIDGTRPWFEDLTVEGLNGGPMQQRGMSGAELKRILKRVPDSERLAALEKLTPITEVPGDQLRPEDLPILINAGIEIGNHTLTHPCLPMCPTAKIKHEIAEAHRLLTSILGGAPRAVAYPNGDWDDRVVSAARDQGYEAGFLFDHRLNTLPICDRLKVSRVRINSRATDDRFVNLISGLHPALHHARMEVRDRLRAPLGRFTRA